ncbi:MAG: hypothetical protein ABW250_27695, partial [Pyrinomonadaceae bacterium]
MTEAGVLDFPAIVERIREAAGGGSDQAIAERLGLKNRQSVYNMKTKGEGLSLPKLAEIARKVNRSPLWLIFGYELDRVIPIGRAIEATDTEIVSQFTLDELSAVGELARSGMSPASVIHVLASEALMTRGQIRRPPEIPVTLLEPETTDDDDLVRTVIKGEILQGGVARIFPNVRTVNIPKQFRPGADKDDWAHPNTFHGYYIRTDEFAYDGLLNGDIVLCAAAYYYTIIEDGQPVLIPLEDKVVFARFYRDAFSGRFIF